MNLNDLAAAAAGMSSERRLYRLEGTVPAASLHVETFTTHEALHEPWRMIISCLSETPRLNHNAMLYGQVTLVTTLADGSEFRRTGIVEQAVAIRGALVPGRLFRYRLTVMPWLGLAHYDIRSQVWTEISLVRLLDSVLGHYAQYGRWRWSPCALEHLSQSPQGGVLSQCTQYRETYLFFVRRMLAEAGLTFRFEESGPGEPATMVIVADTTRAQSCPEDVCSASPLGGPGIRFHRAAPTEVQDTLQEFDASFKWGVHTLRASTSDYKTGQVISACVPTLGEVGGPNAARIESYIYGGAYAWPDNAAAKRYLTMVQQGLEARRHVWRGRGCVRSFTVGTHVVVRGSRMDELAALGAEVPASLVARDSRYLLTQVTHVGINNLPAEMLQRLPPQRGVRADGANIAGGHRPGVEQIANLPGVDDTLRAEAALRGYANRFEVSDASKPWRAMMAEPNTGRLAPRPKVSGALIATVVGPDGSTKPSGPNEVYMDRLGRVKVRFAFQGHPSNDPLASLMTAWMRVMQPIAGRGLRSQFIPRIGQEVLVSFFDSDIDRGMVIRALYNGRGEGGVPATPGGQPAETDTSVFATSTNHRPSGQGNLTGGNSPPWHGASPQSVEAGGQNNAAAISGLKTKEFGGDGFNQTLFDDTDGELRTQLATTQHHSQLNIGHLIHQADNHRGSFRGKGFELRTDAYGALRGARSVHMTTYATAAGEPAMDQAASIAMARQYAQLTEAFSKAAAVHRTVRLSSFLGSHAPSASLAHDTLAAAEAWLASVSGMADANAAQALEDAANRLTTPADGKLPHPTDPTVSIAARAGLIATAGQDIALTASDGVNLASGGTADAAVGGAMRIHTGQAIGILAGAIEPTPEGGSVPPPKGTGLTMVAGSGDLSVEAQNGTLQLAAKGDMTLQSAAGEMIFKAFRRIVISNSHGSQITIGDGQVVIKCPGVYTSAGGMKSLLPGETVEVQLPLMPRHICVECLLNGAAQQSAFAKRA